MIDGPFYLVWNPARELPRKTHEFMNQAEAEARRLAAKHPGEEFFVLQARKVDVEYIRISENIGDDGIPF